MNFTYQATKQFPKDLSYGVIYHDPDFELAEFLCACGCGHRVTLLVPDGHQITVKKGLPTVSPSIASCDAECRSHYFIRSGKVEWLPPFTEAQAAKVIHDQIARHAWRDFQQTWFTRGWAAVVRTFNKVKAFFTDKN